MASTSLNEIPFRPLSRLKRLFVRPGRRDHRVVSGLFKGIRLELDLQHQTQIYLGLYETETFSALRRASACSWVVDVGAGAGELSIFFLRQPQCNLVHAFEPQQNEVAIFNRNLTLNSLEQDKRLTIHQKFAGDGDGTSHVPIDGLDLSAGGYGLIKIDVDGFELDVLNSAKQTLKDGNVDVLVEVHSEQLELDCIDFLTALGYNVNIIANAWWRFAIPERRPIPHNRWIIATKPT